MRMHPGIRALLAAFAALILTSIFAAPAGAGDRVRSERVEVSLVAESASFVPGRDNWVGLRFKLSPDWHIYWRNPGDSGYPPSFDWTLPAGVAAGDVAWPVPARIPVGPLVNFGYAGEVLLAVPLRFPAGFKGGRARLALSAEWLVCREDCIPETGRFELTLPVSTTPVGGEHSRRFAANRNALPASAPPPGWSVVARVESGKVAVRVEPAADVPQLADLVFYPFGEGLMQAAAGQGFTAEATGYGLRLAGAESPVGEWTRLAGLLVGELGASNADGSPRRIAFAVDVPIGGAGPGKIIPASSTAAPQSGPAAESPGFLVALLLALLGGMLLNLMPCVFPILSLKLFGLLRDDDGSAGARRARRVHASCYLVGVVACFVGLAGLLLLLRAGGSLLGWGFQLQSPAFVTALAVLFFALGLSLSGALPIAAFAADEPGAWRARHPQLDALASGALAVLVASPCTAPFMGAALGAALVLPASQALAIFAALGLGMAAPYALLATRPGARRLLPKPGPWLERFKELLAFPLYATVVWLAWVLAEQAGADALPWLGGGLLLVALFAWSRRLGGSAWRHAFAIGVAVALAGTLLSVPEGEPPDANRPSAAKAVAGTTWEAWSPETLAAARAAGQPVFVDFTAAWCVTCQVNKRFVLARDDVRESFAKAGVRLLRADWTRRDAVIARELARLGRNGVPVYALYPASGEPILLPEILTPDLVRSALARLPR